MQKLKFGLLCINNSIIVEVKGSNLIVSDFSLSLFFSHTSSNRES